MTEDQVFSLSSNGNWTTDGQHFGSDRDMLREDQATVHLLLQAVVTRFPAPGSGAAWQSVISAHALLGASAHLADDHQRHSALPPLVRPGGPQLPAMPSPHATSAPVPHVRWRAVLAVLALAAVVVLGLLGPLHSMLEWSWPLTQRGNVLPMQEGASSDQDVLALDPTDLLVQLGSGWSVVDTRAGVVDGDAPPVSVPSGQRILN